MPKIAAPSGGIIEQDWFEGDVDLVEDDYLISTLYPKYLETLDCADDLKGILLSAYLNKKEIGYGKYV